AEPRQAGVANQSSTVGYPQQKRRKRVSSSSRIARISRETVAEAEPSCRVAQNLRELTLHFLEVHARFVRMTSADERDIVEILEHVLKFDQREKGRLPDGTEPADVHRRKAAVVVGDVGVWNAELVSIVMAIAQLDSGCSGAHVGRARFIDDARAEVMDLLEPQVRRRIRYAPRHAPGPAHADRAPDGGSKLRDAFKGARQDRVRLTFAPPGSEGIAITDRMVDLDVIVVLVALTGGAAVKQPLTLGEDRTVGERKII